MDSPVDELSGKETILVVEDEDIVRRVVLKKLRRHGYTVLEAANGKEVPRVLAEHDGLLDMVITDVTMPEMNGHEIVDSICQKYPHVAVLFMSGYPEDMMAHRGVLKPGNEFIEKSHISGDGLLKKVRQVLKNKKYPSGNNL